jgi:hypothetical protein
MTTDPRDRAEIIDALYRFGLGQDLEDRELFAIVDTILALFEGRVDTTHQVTNPRVTVDGDTARLTALVEAQHLLSDDHGRHALLKNRYDVTLVRDGDRWVMRRVRIENAWYTGDPVAIFG